MSTIMHVDDEELILKAISRDLKRADRKVECFSNPEEALEYLQTRKVDLIISDYRMPVMDGVTFLSQSRKLCPDAMRIIVSGHADLQFLKEAINEAEIYRFVAKPWDSFELESAVRMALEFKELQEENRRLADTVRTQKTRLDRQQREMEQMEALYPGITQVTRDQDGAIILDDADI